ncbi:hypothetical protein CBER1_11111 [Cercospora berteroae]|uniref:Uncharacterized protein n=1 Tax=Cercospora berteroae TaxID=357750 RepID=A0A2S6CAX2_9PEZI|nr:hypothetical protein CBER1_11111 [Cercospora berteroae]
MPLNYAKCAELHNQIVRISWEATGRSFEDAPFQSFWTAQQSLQEPLQAVLRTETIEFYKSALVPSFEQSIEDDYQNFFYFCSGLASPIAEFNRDAMKPLNKNQGSSLDQETGRAIMQPDLFSYDSRRGDMPWQALDHILQSYIDMINVGKVVAGNFKADDTIPPFGMASPQYPWKLASFSTGILDMTLTAWDKLIEAIEQRLPPHEQIFKPSTETLAPSEVLDQGEYPRDCFVRYFLSRAQRPRKIQFIAPGISLPTEDTLIDHPFKELARQHKHASPSYGMSIPSDEDPLLPPYLLFPAMSNNNSETIPTTLATGRDVERAFEHPFDSLHKLPAGLYLDTSRPWCETAHEDASMLILPFDVGGQEGHAEYNDHIRVVGPSKTELYQTKINRFIPGHRTQLHLILDSWRGMIEEGHWIVDEQGVSGGIERFREVDESAAMARRYTAASHW